MDEFFEPTVSEAKEASNMDDSLVPTVAIPTSDGKFFCDACGFEVYEDDEYCTHCLREIDWRK